MTVIDLRDDMYKRRIEIIEIDDGVVYYAEELKINGSDSVCIYGYSFDESAEQLLSCFVFQDAAYIQHYYTGKESIIVLFENSGSTAWLVKVDKKTGEEVYRKCIPLIGSYCDCVAIDDDNILIYTKADSEHKDMFNRCLEATNCDALANLYDLSKNERHFVRDFNTAMLVRNSMQTFSSNGEDWMLLSDPYGSEGEKEKLIERLGKVEEDVSDNIWVISKEKFLSGIRGKKENSHPRRIASVGAHGSVQFECLCGEDIVFRAKSFVYNTERFCVVPSLGGKLRSVMSISDDDTFFTDSDSGKIYSLSETEDRVELTGKINSDVKITYPQSIGKFVKCVDDRYIIAEDSSDGKDYVTVYDSELDVKDIYQASGKIRGEVLVLY